MKRKKNFLLIGLITYIQWCSMALAQTTNEKVSLEPTATLLISEISFKKKDGDFIKLYYKSPTQKTLNIKGIQFEDDKIFKKIENDFFLNSGSFMTLYFKNTTSDNPSQNTIYTAHTGLTATTEQLIVRDENSKILDAVCWSNSTPAAKEIKDMEKLFQENGWLSSDPKSCLESETIKSSENFVRHNLVNDRNTKEDWSKTLLEPVKKENAIRANQSSEKTAKKSTPAPQKKPSIKKTPNKKYKDGGISKEIFINEIFPHPQKDGRKNEWIELYNSGEKDIDLGNWQLDDEEGGSKAYIIPNIKIKSHGFLIIKSEQSKISLGDSKDQVRLFDPTKKLLQTIEYKEAPTEESFAQTSIYTEDGGKEKKWLWGKNSTPEQQNPDYYELSGKILGDAEIEELYSFNLQTTKKDTKRIIFDEKLIKAPLAKITFTKNAEIKIWAIRDTQNENTYFLKKYEILKNPETKASPKGVNIGTIIGILIGIGSIGYFLFQKKKHRIETKITKVPQ